MKNSFFAYAFKTLMLRRRKNIFIFSAYTLIIFLISSVFFVSDSLQRYLTVSLHTLPDIFIQKYSSGRQVDLEENMADKIAEIYGVSKVSARYWGYYYFEYSGVNFSLIGVDRFDRFYRGDIERYVDNLSDDFFNGNNMILGKSIYDLFQEIGYKNFAYLDRYDGEKEKINIYSHIDTGRNIGNDDIMLVSKETAKLLLGIKDENCTDIVVNVANPNETYIIAAKIKEYSKNLRVLTKNDIRVSYQNIFDYKNGIFIALFISALVTFLFIVLERLSSISNDEKREIAVYRAVGWSITDIIKWKISESIYISIGAFTLGICLSLLFVFLMNAPILRDIFVGYSNLRVNFVLPFYIDIKHLFLSFSLTVPLYIAASIIPAWKISIVDVREALH